MASILFANVNFTHVHVKITQHWKSTLRQVVRKQVSFQDRKKENKPKFSSIEKWCEAAFWRYLRLLLWVTKIFFIKHFIAAIKNIRFEIYYHFIWSQTYIIFYFSRRLFAKHHTLSFWSRILSSRSRSRKIRILSISIFFVYCDSDIDFTKSYILTNFNS